jgi:cytoskeleton protein RodZ
VNDVAASDAEASAGPGPLLRRAREARALTEQQAAEQLNLDVAVVAALERGDFAALGAPVFARGHLRRYGAMLGLAEDDVLAAYEQARAQPETPTLIPRSRQEMMPERARPKSPWVLGGALLFVLAAGLAAYVSKHGLAWPFGWWQKPATAVEQDVAGAPAPEASTAVAPAAGGLVSAEPASAAPAAVTEVAPPPVPPGHVSISLAFAADSWTEIYDGSGKAVLYDLGKAGTQRTIAAAAPLSVTIGNAPTVTISVNGRRVDVPVAPGGGTVGRFKIEADGTVR